MVGDRGPGALLVFFSYEKPMKWHKTYEITYENGYCYEIS